MEGPVCKDFLKEFLILINDEKLFANITYQLKLRKLGVENILNRKKSIFQKLIETLCQIQKTQKKSKITGSLQT